ncbi:DNA-binding FadR family transcriptional regulator [Actinoplanes campanulatus]|uniref:DNA-binding FadR family transcriptional regulator n=1 Tax=Actinoplanes campanulatus TaxID=113559 RepID=A0A7W5FDT0_9ACTN|nr:GntR family transcriptional regulator [Actinoplanes campanulatus]MBB3094617.1 DNA-binding FadR family transcriptional regulator [Actinoplanes campanulatus]GGN06338.1 GntR family transcriptional regulator [Actinoplanes campanulatus]GID35913.1 GntR family transcriptional regulator [Actinoplanes campanulatus]
MGTSRASARSVVFAPLDPHSRAETVVRRLTDAITFGLLTDAEQLPSETDLAAQFGVSRVTVREALVALRQQNLVETRRGRGGGSFVRAPTAAADRSLRSRLSELSLPNLRDTADHYAAVAGAAARLAAQRADADDILRIEEVDADVAGPLHRMERAYHLEVAAVAQSARLAREEIRFAGELGTLLWSPILQTADSTYDPHAEHRAITAAIAAGDGDLARRLTEEHIETAVERLVTLHLTLVEP